MVKIRNLKPLVGGMHPPPLDPPTDYEMSRVPSETWGKFFNFARDHAHAGFCHIFANTLDKDKYVCPICRG